MSTIEKIIVRENKTYSLLIKNLEYTLLKMI